MIDPTSRNINMLLFLSFQNCNNDPTRDFFHKYYLSLVDIKDFNALIDNKLFFDQPVKSEQDVYEKLVKTSREK